jgi:hypothetical protein
MLRVGRCHDTVVCLQPSQQHGHGTLSGALALPEAFGHLHAVVLALVVLWLLLSPQLYLQHKWTQAEEMVMDRPQS